MEQENIIQQVLLDSEQDNSQIKCIELVDQKESSTFTLSDMRKSKNQAMTLKSKIVTDCNTDQNNVQQNKTDPYMHKVTQVFDMAKNEQNKIKKYQNYMELLYKSCIFIEDYRIQLFNEKGKEKEKEQKKRKEIDHINFIKADEELLKYYFKKIITQNIKGNENSEEETKLQILLFYIKTFFIIFLYPLSFIVFRYKLGDKFGINFKLLIKQSIPLFYLKTINQLRKKSIISAQNIFSNDVIINNGDDQKNIKQQFDKNSCFAYIYAFIIINLIIIAAVFNFIGIVEFKETGNKVFSNMFGINFIVLLYIILNIITNIYISFQANCCKYQSQKEELENLMNQELIQKNQFYLEFINIPIEENLITQIQLYDQVFNESPDYKKTMQYDIKDDLFIDEVVLSKNWISGLGLFIQYLYQNEHYSQKELPYLCETQCKYINKKIDEEKSKNCFRKTLIRFYNYILFPSLLIGFLAKITQKNLKNLDFKQDVGKYSILLSLWISMFLYLFVQFNNKYVKKSFQSKLYALQRLGLMISLQSQLDYIKVKKELPTINLFCLQSIQTWYDLRVFVMQYRINSLNGWVTLLFIEFSLIFFESLSEFFDKSGEISNELISMDIFLRLLIITGFIQRIGTFLIPSLFQQAKINYQYQIHRKLLSDHLYKLEQLKTQFKEFKVLQEHFEFELEQMTQDNQFGVTMEIFIYEARKQIRRHCNAHFLEKKNPQEVSLLRNDNDNEYTKYGYLYLESLISKYQEILELIDKDISKHQIFIFGYLPISYQLMSLIFVSFLSYVITTIIDKSTDKFDQVCSSLK